MAVQYYNNFVDTTNFSDTTGRATLTAGVAQTYTVPGNSTQRYQVIFSFESNSNVFVGYNYTPTVPADDTVEETGSVEYKPQKRTVKGGDVLHFISPDTRVWCGWSLRSLPSGL